MKGKKAYDKAADKVWKIRVPEEVRDFWITHGTADIYRQLLSVAAQESAKGKATTTVKIDFEAGIVTVAEYPTTVTNAEIPQEVPDAPDD